MKRFTAAILAVALLLTCADLSAINLGPIIAQAAANATDAYTAYDQLRAKGFSSLQTAISNANGAENDREQNEEIDRYKMIFGQVNGGTAQSGGWPTGNSGITSPDYSFPVVFNQTGIDGTSQVKAGEWLNETTYDSTAGMPTTENVFVTIGGTKYVVDLSYEIINRPYIRRYHFDAWAPNYRYYKIDQKLSGGATMQLEWEATENTKWDHTLAYKAGDAATNKARSLMYFNNGNDDLRDRNMAYVAASAGLRANGEGTALEQKVVPYPNTAARGIADVPAAAPTNRVNQGIDRTWNITKYPEEKYRIDNWFACDWNRTVDSTTMSPGMAAAILYKKQIREIILELKEQYKSIDDNYRADEGAYNIDKETSDNVDWYFPDKVGWMYTYYGMVRKDAGGNGAVGGGGVVESSVDTANSRETYKSENVWDPIIVSYIYDWDSYGTEKLDNPNMAAQQDSDVATPAKLLAASGSEQDIWEAIAQDIEIRCDGANGFGVTPKRYSVCAENTANFQAGTQLVGGGTNNHSPSSYQNFDQYGWYNHLGLYTYAYQNLKDYGTAIDKKTFAKQWCVYLTDLPNVYSTKFLNISYHTELSPQHFGSGAGVYNNMHLNIAGNGSNALTENYYMAMNDLFCSVSGLFYTDEIEELFGGDKLFPGFKMPANTTAANKQVAQNLHDLFGAPIGKDDSFVLDTSWSIPWAVFPYGGDLDGHMEDIAVSGLSDSWTTAQHTSALGDVADTLQNDEYAGIMWACPQYVKYSKFDMHVKWSAKSDPMRSSTGHEYYYTFHEKRETERKTGHNHTNLTTNCKDATDNAHVGVGEHGCEWCGTCNDFVTTSCTTNSAGNHVGGTVCTETCLKHWHSFSNQTGANYSNSTLARGHELRTYKENIQLEGWDKPKLFMGNENAEGNPGNSQTWTEDTKEMSYSEVIAQVFRDVRYLNIASFSIWEYDRAEVRGLGQLLAIPVTTAKVTNSAEAGQNLIVTKALSSMGYTLYDLDEKSINDNLGSGGISGSPNYWNNLQLAGRLANSFNACSMGNLINPYRRVVHSTASSFETYGGDTRKYRNDAVNFINTSDVPILRYIDSWKETSDSELDASGSSIRIYRNFVNGDRSAFHLVKGEAYGSSDDLYFTYDPLSQGGRSHSTFSGFIAQALARTFYTFGVNGDGDITSGWHNESVNGPSSNKKPYSNSLRIQGDYLAIRDLHDQANTIAGSMYDTWDETADESYPGGASKFNLLKIQVNGSIVPLAQYLVADYWVMGDMSYILSRVPYYYCHPSNPYGNADAGFVQSSSGITCFTNCWMIHTFSSKINGAGHSAQDGLIDNLGLIKGWNYQSQLGDVNPYAAFQGTNEYAIKYGSTRNNKGQSVKLEDSLNTYGVQRITVGGIPAIQVPLTYKHEGNNAGVEPSNWLNHRTENLVSNTSGDLPYIGYQSEGIGVQNIVETGNGTTTQTGWTDSNMGYAFNSDKTMITGSDGNPNNGSGTYRDQGGFERFGINVLTGTNPATSKIKDGREIVMNEDVRVGNSHPLDTDEQFSKWYPWLSDLNINRFLPNGRYFSGQIYNVYKEIVRHADGGGAGGSYDYNRVPNGTGELRVNTHYTRSGSSIGGTDSDTLPNSIVMYNPATTFTAHLVEPSEYMPDAVNYGYSGEKDGSGGSSEYHGSAGELRYLAGFGKGNGELVLRDQRIARHTSYGSEGKEDYTSGSGTVTVTGTTSTSSYHYELRYHDAVTQNFSYYESLIETRAYVMKDWDIRTTQNEVIELDTTTEGHFKHFTEKTTVKIVTKDTSGSYHSATVEVNPGDTISWEDSAVVMTRGSDNFDLWYSAFQDAFEAMQLSEGVAEGDLIDTIDYIPMTRGTVMNPVNGTFDMKKGSVIELSLPLTNSDGNAIDLPFNLELPDGFIWKHDANGIYHTFYIEATEDGVLSSIQMTATIDYRIPNFNESAIKAHNILLLSVGIGNGLNQEPVTGITTLDYYYESRNWSVNSTERWGSYNTTVVDISGSHEFLGVEGHVFIENHLYIQDQNGQVTVTLNQNDPHAVPNTNWRYYVLGWKTEYGDFITSVWDPVLAENSTVRLIPPIGATDDNYLDATTLDNLARNNKLGVGRYGYNFYLMELAGDSGDDQYDHTLNWYGLTIQEFDTLSFGEETTKTYGTLVSWEQTSWEQRMYIYLKSYELVFRCSWGEITETTEIETGYYETCTREIRAYDVKYSGNIEHKLTIDIDISLQDWIRVPDIVNEVVITKLKDASGDYVSLDDEYILYWDNMVDLVDSNATAEQRGLSKNLGRGWDINTDDSKNVNNSFSSLKNNPTGMFASVWKDNMTDVNGKSKYTDTTKWIYSKYVTFNVDMYGFTEGTAYTLQPCYDPKNPGAGQTSSESIRQFDPTTPAYNITAGKYNNLVYIPAGTPVHLGYYLGDDTEDNSGEFVDYGYNIGGTTNDPNDDHYVYHFWCPLEVGESDSQVVAEFHMTTINNGDTEAGNQAAWNWGTVSRYRRTAEAFAGLDTAVDDEWGNDVLKVGSTVNADNENRISSIEIINNSSPDIGVMIHTTDGAYTRPGNSYNTAIMSVAGRIGALTIVDSGDPRYQDSFKNRDNDHDYAIYPIVFAVTKYSNRSTPIGYPGSQNRYLTDKSDVRGRMWIYPNTSLSYTFRDPFNTYGTQWFMSDAYRFKLPMGKDFNIHADSDLPEQRLGYSIYCSLETIGNYYGSAHWRLTDTEVPANLNDDYGQTKVQIRPFFTYLDTETGETFAVDVYMRRNGNYVLLNAGSQYSSAEENSAEGGTDYGPYWVDAAHSAYYTVSIKSNTEVNWDDAVEKTYRLDQTLLRRMVTEKESSTTYRVVQKQSQEFTNKAISRGITETILRPFTLDTSAEEDLLDYNYYYGNSQIEFLREQNRTFIGGVSEYIKDNKESDWTDRAKRYGQKWYFELGLPSTAIFVKHGSHEFTNKTILNGKHGVILVSIDVYAGGEKWVLHYQSDISKDEIKVDNTPFTDDEWKVYPDQLPNLIPVYMYRADQLAPNDIEDRGTY